LVILARASPFSFAGFKRSFSPALPDSTGFWLWKAARVPVNRRSDHNNIEA
jgi:hypothetical protein